MFIPSSNNKDKWKVRRLLGVGSWFMSIILTIFVCAVTLLVPEYSHTANVIMLIGIFVGNGISYIVSATLQENRFNEHDTMFRTNTYNNNKQETIGEPFNPIKETNF